MRVAAETGRNSLTVVEQGGSMFYSWTCPNCGNVTRANFVRVGAVFDCLHCRERTQIRPEQIHRLAAPVSEPGPRSDTVPGLDDADVSLAVVEAEQTNREGGNADTVLGAVPLPAAEPPADRTGRPPDSGPMLVPVATREAGEVPKARFRLARVRRRRARRQWLTVLALLAVLLLLGAGLFWLLKVVSARAPGGASPVGITAPDAGRG